MRIFYCSVIVFMCCLSGCKSSSDAPAENLTGNWLIVFPDHQLKSKREREVYGKYQDSVVNLYGLKLVNFQQNGAFVEMDSLLKPPAKWTFHENQLTIQEGGKGFNPFKTNFEAYENDTLRLVQFLSLDQEKIKVVWHLKKVDSDTDAVKLFSPEWNTWRKKPAASESDAAIRKRLVSILNYYSTYLKLVSKESSYFLIPRIPLPFHYYQHAMGLRQQMPAEFVRLFYTEEDAKKAYNILEQTLQKLTNQFEWGENFVTEYAAFMKKMTIWIAN